MKNLNTTLTVLFLWLLIPFSLSAVGGASKITKPQLTVENGKNITAETKKKRKAKRTPLSKEEKIARRKRRVAITSMFLFPFAFIGLAVAVRVLQWARSQDDPSKHKSTIIFAKIGIILCAITSGIVATATVIGLLFLLLSGLGFGGGLDG